MRTWGKTALVVFGALIITALGIDASDTLTGSEGTLLSQVIRSSDQGACPRGMSFIENGTTVTCVDTYEVSTGKDCPAPEPESMLASLKNVESSNCLPESKAEANPWRYVTRDQAMQMCARAHKRLPTSEEWYALSLGMVGVESSCNVDTDAAARTGAYTECITPHGAFDLVGNVWEWVSDDVIDGKYRERELPKEGYVAQVDVAGMATESSETPQELFGNDYFWSQTTGAYGIIRGGYYGSGKDAGLYAVHADTPPTSASAGIGFRCVK